MTFIFRNRTIFWDIPKRNRGQTKWDGESICIYSIRPIFFVLFEKLNFLRKYHLLSCLPFKNVEVSKTTRKKIYQKIELLN